MNICKDCSHFRGPEPTTYLPVVPVEPRCHHPNSFCDQDRIWGYDVFYTCKAIRNSKDKNVCGPDGKFFTPITK